MRECTTQIIVLQELQRKSNSYVNKLNIEKLSKQLHNYFDASIELMQVMARACDHNDLSKFTNNDLATWQ